MPTITPGAFHRLPMLEQTQLLRWLARHRLDPNTVYSVTYDAGTVAEVVVYDTNAEGHRYVRAGEDKAATRTLAIECPDDAPPIPAEV